jgi:enoyl-CoA hydratase/carnithine racemase
MTDLLRAELTGSVLRIVMNDNASRNSLSEEMMEAMSLALDDAADNRSCSVVVIAAEGPVFCAGHNLKQLTASRQSDDRGQSYFARIFEQCSGVMMKIVHHRCPVIAEVQGLASAAGCQLVATCDLAYASTSAGFCTPGVNIGLFCSTPMVALSRSVSHKHAMEMLLTGDVIDAETAARIGLINRAVDPAMLRQTVDAVASRIASKSQTATRYGKRSYHDQLNQPLEKAYLTTQSIMVSNMLDGAACEGIEAFLAKRAPKWQ